MDKYKIEPQPETESLHQLLNENGDIVCRDMTKKEAAVILSGLDLLESLTPDEGLVADEKSINVQDCQPEKWYYDSGTWYLCMSKTVNGDGFFVYLLNGELHPASASVDCDHDLHPAVKRMV